MTVTSRIIASDRRERHRHEEARPQAPTVLVEEAEQAERRRAERNHREVDDPVRPVDEDQTRRDRAVGEPHDGAGEHHLLRDLPTVDLDHRAVVPPSLLDASLRAPSASRNSTLGRACRIASRRVTRSPASHVACDTWGITMRARYGPVGCTTARTRSRLVAAACSGGSTTPDVGAEQRRRGGAASHRRPGVVAVHVDDCVLHQGHREAHGAEGVAHRV